MSPKVINYEGKFAIDLGGWIAAQKEPVEIRTLEVSNADLEDYAPLEGHPVEFKGNVGVIYHNGFPIVCRCGDKKMWRQVVERRPVKKPRKGRDYDWKWVHGRWEKRYT